MRYTSRFKIRMEPLAALAVAGIIGGCASRAPAQREPADVGQVREERAAAEKAAAAKMAQEKAESEAEESKLSGLGAVKPSETSSEIRTRKEVIETHRIPTVEERSLKADINRLDQSGFVALGLKPEVASAIVDYRAQHGRFTSEQDLRKVPGMDLSWFESMEGMLGASPVETG